NVLSHCGSFTNIWGGHNFPYLVRTTPRKPLKVFLQSGANDEETLLGDGQSSDVQGAGLCRLRCAIRIWGRRSYAAAWRRIARG
ncbi:hypothetical protein N9X32_07320, partial [Pseudomonadales bacterium]|nr:hypothetical protein [Pseudomonadales bacterium]